MKDQILKELGAISEKLGRSPGRRDIPWKLNLNCINYFGSFNNAKLEANLLIVRRTCNPLPKKSTRLDKKLVRIVSYLTFDGHLGRDLKSLYYSSNNKKELENFRECIYSKFGIYLSKIEKGNGFGNKNLKYWYFNSNLCKFLHLVGTPKGDKMVNKFDVPVWIKKDKSLAKEYLKIAFLCEGCRSKASKNTEKIQINLNKSEEILIDGLIFMSSLKELLQLFNIKTTKINLQKGNIRKRDRKITKMMRFYVRSKDTNKFINNIGWLK